MVLAQPMNVTYHRAFDVARNPLQAFEEIIQCGCNRLLTSGQEKNAQEGLPLLKKLVEQAKGRVVIMPACGITSANIKKIIDETGATEIHVGRGVCEEVESSGSGMFSSRRQVVNMKKVVIVRQALG